MRRVAGGLVVCLFAGAAAWVGCQSEYSEQAQGVIIGSDAGMGGDAYGGGSGTGTDGGIGSDAGLLDGSGEGGPGVDGSIGSMDGGIGASDGGDGGGVAGNSDGGGTGTGDPLRPGGGGSLQRTSFYACAGGPGSAGIEVGLPIGLALAFAVRRRRRYARG